MIHRTRVCPFIGSGGGGWGFQPQYGRVKLRQDATATNRRTDPDALARRLVAAALLLLVINTQQPALAQVDVARQSFPDVTTEQWNELAESRSVIARLPTVMQIISRLPNVSKSSWQEYLGSSAQVDLQRAADTPAEYAGAAFRLSGRTTGLSRITLNEQLQRDYSYDKLFVVDAKRDDGRRVVLVSPIVPEIWQRDAAMAEPFAARGILVTVRNDGVPVFVTLRVRWYPDRENEELQIGAGQLALARHGLDLGQRDMILNRSLEAFTYFERDLFDQWCGAIVRMESDPPATRGQPLDLRELLEHPQRHAGDLIELSGHVRRIVPVQNDSPSLRAATGRQQYYHVDFFVSLGNQGFRLKDTEGEVTIYGSYGVTLVLFDLPDELRNADSTMKWSIPAFFVKTWLHKTVATREVSSELRRPNPVFFGLGSLAELIETDEAATHAVSSLIAWFWVALGVLVSGLLVWLWRSSATRRQNRAGPPVDWSSLD